MLKLLFLKSFYPISFGVDRHVSMTSAFPNQTKTTQDENKNVIQIKNTLMCSDDNLHQPQCVFVVC